MVAPCGGISAVAECASSLLEAIQPNTHQKGTFSSVDFVMTQVWAATLTCLSLATNTCKKGEKVLEGKMKEEKRAQLRFFGKINVFILTLQAERLILCKTERKKHLN